MARVDGNKDYQYYVEAVEGNILILDLLIKEGVQPGGVLRLVVKGHSGKGGIDVLYKREGPSSFSASSYHQYNPNKSASDIG